MKQLTLRGFTPDLERRLRREARRRHTSLNRAALYLLGKGAGLAEDGEANVVGNSLDEFIGSWSAEEAREFDLAVADLGVIDEEFWK